MTWKPTSLGLMMMLLLAGLGCSDSDGVVSCDLAGNGMHLLCHEVPASYRQDLRQTCQAATQEGGTVTVTYSDGPCSRVDALGGCALGNESFTTTVWYYKTTSPGAQADIPALCKAVGATYISP